MACDWGIGGEVDSDDDDADKPNMRLSATVMLSTSTL